MNPVEDLRKYYESELAKARADAEYLREQLDESYRSRDRLQAILDEARAEIHQLRGIT